MRRGNSAGKFCGVAVMAKASEPGRTKTRLSPPLTLEEAALFNTAFLKDIAANLEEVGAITGIAGYMAYGPPGSQSFFEALLPGCIDLIESWFPTFDLCLMHALSAQFELGHGAACVLNSDSPTLPLAFLIEAHDVLTRPGDRIVLGPSNDGGYYLLGCKQLHRELFRDIAWSTEVVFEQTLDRARAAGLEVRVLPEWYDVDDAASLAMLRAELLDGRPFRDAHRSSFAHHSRALLEALEQEAGLAARLRDFPGKSKPGAATLAGAAA